jgi:AraC-like DNA-binding protein
MRADPRDCHFVTLGKTRQVGGVQTYAGMRSPTASTQGILDVGAVRPFELRRWPPAPDLSEYVERHWEVRWRLKPGDTFTQELLPHPCVNLVSELGRAAVYGLPSRRARRRLEGAGAAVGTKFRPGAFSAFVGLSASGLVGHSFPLAELFGVAGDELERRLAAAGPDADGHVSQVEAFLRQRLPAPDPQRTLVLEVVADMLELHASCNVSDLARRHGVSARTLQRRFRQYIGVGPKWVLKRYRVHEAAERIASGEAQDAARLAADLGYFDQSHLIRDFTAQVGRSPGRYAELCAASDRPASMHSANREMATGIEGSAIPP